MFVVNLLVRGLISELVREGALPRFQGVGGSSRVAGAGLGYFSFSKKCEVYPRRLRSFKMTSLGW